MAKGRCRSGDVCDRPATVSLNGGEPKWCEEHGEQLREVAAAIRKGERPGPKVKPIKTTRTKAGRDALDLDNAVKLARVVQAETVPTTGVHRRIGLRYGSEAWKNAVALATEKGWVRLDEGRGFVAGDVALSAAADAQPAGERLPRRTRALRLARAVHASAEPLSLPEAAAAAGVAPTAVTRIASFAREQGWIESKRGPEGGYVATDAELPSA